jgi:transketolase
VVVLVGDAELNEGSNSEAMELAPALLMDRLTVVVVDNRSSSYGVGGRIGERFRTEGWQVVEVDGRDHVALTTAFQCEHPGRPLAVVAVIDDDKE